MSWSGAQWQNTVDYPPAQCCVLALWANEMYTGHWAKHCKTLNNSDLNGLDIAALGVCMWRLAAARYFSVGGLSRSIWSQTI
eukprot:6467377-Amphidinium_carterae.1